MPKGCSIANTGDGKTIAVVARAYTRLKNEPDLNVYANFHIKLPRCHYSPHMFLDFEKLGKSMIIYDDVSNAKVLERYAGVCANLSRKTFMDLVFTGQGKTMIPKVIRDIMDYRLYPNIRGNTLYITERRRGKQPLKYKYTNCFKTIGRLYNTNEIVPITLESDIIKEIIKLSKTKRQVEIYLMIYSGNYAKRERLLKIIMKKMKIDNEDEEKNKLTFSELSILNKVHKKSYGDLSQKTGIPHSTLYTNIKKTEFNINKKFNELYNQNE